MRGAAQSGFSLLTLRIRFPRIGRNRRTTGLRFRLFQFQNALERKAVPTNPGVGLDDDERVAPAAPDAGEDGPEQPIALVEALDPRNAVQDCELMAPREVLEHQVATRAEDRENRG